MLAVLTLGCSRYGRCCSLLLPTFTPSTFTPIGPLVPSLLMLIMFGMGVHLKVDDFKTRAVTPGTGRGGDFSALPGDAARRLAAGTGVPYATGAFRRNGTGRQRRQRYGI